MSQAPSDVRPKVPRKFGRLAVKCEAVLAFPSRQAHPRLKAHLFQIGKGGCAVIAEQRFSIGEQCLVWATPAGHKLLGAAGRIVWSKSVYQDHEIQVVGIEFAEPIKLTSELLKLLHAKT